MSNNSTQELLNRTTALTDTVAANRFIDIGGAYPSAGAAAHGVTYDDGDSGDDIGVTIIGTQLLEMGGSDASYTAGQEVTTDEVGKGVACTEGDIVNGILMEAGSTGDKLECLVVAPVKITPGS